MKTIVVLFSSLFALAAHATCPNVDGTWECTRDFDNDVQQMNISSSVSGGVTTYVMGGDSNVADGAWHQDGNIEYRYTCGTTIPLKSEYTPDSKANPIVINYSEWYPNSLTAPTEMTLVSSCPSCGSGYPETFGYECEKL